MWYVWVFIHGLPFLNHHLVGHDRPVVTNTHYRFLVDEPSLIILTDHEGSLLIYVKEDPM